jgi:hypothetical protein
MEISGFNDIIGVFDIHFYPSVKFRIMHIALSDSNDVRRGDFFMA